MHLDLRTISIMIAVSSLIYGMSVLLVTANLPRGLVGGRTWALGSLTLFGGWLLLGLRAYVPDFYSVVVGNSLLVLSFGLYVDSLQKFRGRPRSSRLVYGFAGLIAVLLYLFLDIFPSITARVVLVSSIGAIIYFYVSYSFLQARIEIGSPDHRLPSFFVEAVGVLTAIVFLARAVFAILTMQPEDSLFEPNYFSEISFIIFFISSVLLSFGFVLMNLMRANVELERLARYDSLTGAMNRHAILDHLERQLNGSARAASPLSLVLIDLDGFKQVNDRLGHPEGDRVLAAIGGAITSVVDGRGSAGRMGGDEFLLVLGNTDADEAVRLAEDLRVAVRASLEGFEEPAAGIRLSIGVSEYGRDNTDDLIHRTDAALYSAKNAGGDRVVLGDETGEVHHAGD